MKRRTAVLLALGAAATALLLGPAPAEAAEDDPVVAGTFKGTLKINKSWQPGGWGTQEGPRTYSFGTGCPVSEGCSFDNSSGGGTAPWT